MAIIYQKVKYGSVLDGQSDIYSKLNKLYKYVPLEDELTENLYILNKFK